MTSIGLELLQDRRFSDVIFTVGVPPETKDFHAHRLVLAAQSRLFGTMLYHPSHFYPDLQKPAQETLPIRLSLGRVDPTTFERLLRCLYTDTIDEVSDLSALGKLIALADKYDTPKVKGLCVDMLVCTVNGSNVFEHFVWAYNVLKEPTLCLDYIRDNTEEVLTSIAFLSLPLELLSLLIQDDQLSIDECILFQQLKRWGKHQLKIRNSSSEEDENEEAKEDEKAEAEAGDASSLRTLLEPVLPFVRFPLMTPTELAEQVGPSNLIPRSHLLSLFAYCSLPESRRVTPLDLPYSTNHRNRILICRESVVLKPKHSKPLKKLFANVAWSRIELSLLYRSSRDGKRASSFHSRCDGKGPTLTLCRAGHRIFGGYFSGSWSSQRGSGKEDAWIFSIVHNEPMKLLPIKGASRTVHHDPSQGPTFCRDLVISGNMTYFSASPMTYKRIAPGFPLRVVTSSMIVGKTRCEISEMEVFTVTMK